MGLEMKAEILSLLRKKADYVSGQELCKYFGVSRTAVWKAVGRLREEGYHIEAVQNRGYRLLDTENVYGQNDICSRIHTKWVGRNVKFYDKLASTNIQAKLEAENGAESGTLIIADMQTAGRGRRGRGWQSPAGTNVYFTLILKPDFTPDKASMLTLVMAMAVAEGIKKTLPDADTVTVADGIERTMHETEPLEQQKEPVSGGLPEQNNETCGLGIKWPNDLVLHGKKICGILTEMSVERDYIQHVVIGVGINVGKQDFEPEVAKKATTLEGEYGFAISRSLLVAETMAVFENLYEIFVRNGNLSGLLEGYNALLVNRDREVCVLDPKGEYHGRAKGITSTGELLVELPDGRITEVYAGEVSVRGIYGYI